MRWVGSKLVNPQQTIEQTRNRQTNDVNAYHKQVNDRQVQNKQLRIIYVQANNTGYISHFRDSNIKF